MKSLNQFIEKTIELKNINGGRWKKIDGRVCCDTGNTVYVYEQIILGIHTGNTATETVSGDRTDNC